MTTKLTDAHVRSAYQLSRVLPAARVALALAAATGLSAQDAARAVAAAAKLGKIALSRRDSFDTVHGEAIAATRRVLTRPGQRPMTKRIGPRAVAAARRVAAKKR